MQERELQYGPHDFFPRLRAASPDELREEMLKPCGRFHNPITIEARLGSFIAEKVRTFDPLGNEQFFLHGGIPLNWELLIGYLHDAGIFADRELQRRNAWNDRPKMCNVGIRLNAESRRTEGHTGMFNGFGASFSPEEAVSKAIGEALERYFLAIYDRSTMRYASESELHKQKIPVFPLSQFSGFLPWQRERFPEFEWSTESPLYWVEGHSFATRKKVHIPAQLVFWNYRHNAAHGRPAEKVLTRGTTSGNAGHFSYTEAVLSGVTELIQRDGFLMYWLNSISPRQVDPRELKSADVDQLQEYLQRYRLEARYLNTTSDIAVPSITCVLIDQDANDGPIISVGGGTGFDMNNNIIHATIEALLINAYNAHLPRNDLNERYEAFADQNFGRDDRLGIWKGPVMQDRMQFLISGEKQPISELVALCSGKDTPDAQLEYIRQELSKLGDGYDIYVYEVQDTVLKDLGYHVVRTIVPQLMPLYLMENAAQLSCKRLTEVPARLGFAPAEKLNPWPHPFP